ncbi:unnamed protein product [Adineta steineri]|uniref:Uncharacterized protein n=1 Tax=Adineta steineri TaxID=433720 RepID=A0A818INQ2_9BILA|nr:unnamed protein product [Adineta steineri]CAF3524477.1 unnamed protein product [Adineta steineri]
MMRFILKPATVLSRSFNFCSFKREKLTDNLSYVLPNGNFCSFNDITSCQTISNRSFLWVMYSYSGFTSELNNMLNGFAYSIATQRRFLVVDTLWNYGSFENYFDTYRSGLSPYSTFDVSCSRRTFTMLDKSHTRNEQTDHIMLSRDENGLFILLNSVTENFHKNIAPIISIQHKRRVAHFLWRYLSNDTQDFVQMAINKSDIDVDVPFYALHIRRGDKLMTESPRNLSIDDYIKGIDHLQKQAKLHDGKNSDL